MTTPDRDRRIAEWARYCAKLPLPMGGFVKCMGCLSGNATVDNGNLCPSCWERIAECVEKADPSNRDPEKN